MVVGGFRSFHVLVLTQENNKLVGLLKRTRAMLLERHATCQTFMPRLTVQVPKIWEISLPR